MAREIEVKYRVSDVAALRERLRNRRAERVGARFELNRILDSPKHTLRDFRGLLRVRSTRDEDSGKCSGCITFKGPRTPGPVKMREEIETSVGDAQAAMDFLARLGYRDFLCYEKRREIWRLANCEVCLDELPRLGWFVEIEGPSAESVMDLAKLLELPEQACETMTYVDLAIDAGTPDEDGRRSLVFGE